MLGPGKYDEVAIEAFKLAGCRPPSCGVLLMVIGGVRGEGFSVTATADVALKLPEMLRTMADQIENDRESIARTT